MYPHCTYQLHADSIISGDVELGKDLKCSCSVGVAFHLNKTFKAAFKLEKIHKCTIHVWIADG